MEESTSNYLTSASHTADKAVVSIAISLKRIADSLEGQPEKYGILNVLSDMLEKMGR